jgi:molybdopterin synthase catalytic subunit
VIHRRPHAPGEAIVQGCSVAYRRSPAGRRLSDGPPKTEAPFWKKEVRPEGAEWIEPRSDDRASRAKWDKT